MPPRARHTSPRVWPVILAGLTVWAAACSDTLEPVHRSPPPQDLPVAAADIIPPKSISPQGDAFIRSDGANKNYGAHDSLLIQKVGNKGAARILVAFPQTGIADSLGADSLVSASLELTIKRTGTDWGITGRAVAVHRLTRAWTEAGATWSCANDLNLGNNKADCTGNTWAMAGATLPFATPAVAQSVITNGRTGVVSFDVSSDIRAFLTTPTTNQGWLLKLAAEAQTGTVVFHSKESATKPRLVLTFYRKSTVPAEAPDLIPEWMYSDTNIANGSASIAAPFTKRIVVVQFEPGATTPQREAAVIAAGGVVVGGIAIAGGEGQYYLRIEDVDGAVLASKAAELRAMPQVASAFVNVAGEVQYRLPNDGIRWKRGDWGLAPRFMKPFTENWAQTAINAPMAWGCHTGESPTAVAVVDVDFRVGLNQDHFKDLQGMSRRTLPGSETGKNNAHGAGVAGLLGAKGNNNEGMTGMLWDADVRLYDYSIHKKNTTTNAPKAQYASAIAAEVQHAAYDGARIINLSQGVNWRDQKPAGQGTAEQRRPRDEFAWALRGALQTMAARGFRPLVVVAAGNYGVDASWSGFPLVRDAFPTQVLSVGGSAENNTLMNDGPDAISNTGAYVDVVAPGSLLTSYDATGNVGLVGSGTSLAAPLVSGIAGLLFSFDPRLTTAEVRQLILDGAVRANRSITKDGHTYYLADAYEALKLAAERRGAPLCGNRLWANASGGVYASRANGPEALFSPPAGERGAFALAPHHGGRQIDMLGWSSQNLAYTLSGTQWSQSSEVPQVPNNQSGVSNSLWGLSHDGRQEVFIDLQAFNSSSILRMQLFDTTGTTTPTALDKVLPQLQAYPDTIAGLGRGTNDEYLLPWAVAYSPTGDHAVIAVSVHRTTATFNGSLKPCPWAADPEAPPDKCFDSITYEKQAVKADLWDYPLPVGEPRFITTLPNTVVGSVAITEDGTQMIINEGMKYEKYDALPSGPEGCTPEQPGNYGYCVVANRTESTASCMITYRSLTTGEAIEPTVPAVYACGLPVGTTAAVIAKAAQRARSLGSHSH